MKINKIFAVNMIIFVIYLAARILMFIFPNSHDRLEAAQNGYSENGESVIDNGWAYYLINDEFPLPDGYIPELKQVQGRFMMDERCADYAKEMIEAAADDGIELTVVSAYRSTEKQAENLAAYTDYLKELGLDEDEARKAALKKLPKREKASIMRDLP